MNQSSEREQQRTEELSAHGLPLMLTAADDCAQSSVTSKQSDEVAKSFCIDLPMQGEVAHKLHKAALMAALIEIDGYAESKWQDGEESNNGYTAHLALIPIDLTTNSQIEASLNSTFTSSKSGTAVNSTLSFEKGTADAALADDILRKIKIMFETALQ